MNTERRQKPRFMVKQMVEISLGREKLLSAKGINISEGGILCQTLEPLELYSKVSILISLTVKEEGFECVGIVVRCEKNNNLYDIAVAFADLREGDKKKIHNFIC